MLPADQGPLDMSALLAQAQQVQQQLARAQEDLAAARVVGTAGGGLVTATVTGTGELVDLKIAEDAYDTDDPDPMGTVADLVLAAVRDASANARQRAAEVLGPFGAALGGDVPGLPGLSEG